MNEEELKHDEFMLFECENWDYLEPVALEEAARELQA
tara:strand:- start:1343 stop:1453 length:111 start_codon:yes stop_codon:yes gene_type:complete